MLAVDLGGCQKNMDAGSLTCSNKGATCCLDVLGHTAGQTGDDGALNLSRYCLHGFKIAVTDDRKPCLDNIDLQSGKLAGNLQLLAQVHGSSGALLAIAQCRIKNQYSVGIHKNIELAPARSGLQARPHRDVN